MGKRIFQSSAVVKGERDINQFVFVHDYKNYEEKPYYKTKLPIAILLEMQALPFVGRNFDQMRILSDDEVFARCGDNALHLMAQKYKQSDDRQTEWRKDFFDYNNGVYLGRGYKMIENDYWKFEINKALIEEQVYLKPAPTLMGTMKLMTRLMRGVPVDFLKHHHFHRGIYTPIPVFNEELSSLSS